MNKKWLKIFGVISLIKGAIFLFLMYTNFTGHVVVENIAGGTSPFIGLVLVIGGILLFVGGLEKQVVEVDSIENVLERRMKKLSQEKDKPSIVFDSSFLLGALGKGGLREEYIQKLIDEGYNVIIPPAVKKEVWELKKVERVADFSGFQDYIGVEQEMRRILRRTQKYIDGQRFLACPDINKIPRNLKHIKLDAVKSLRERDLLTAESSPAETRRKIRDWVRKHYVEVENDAKILASAVYRERTAHEASPAFVIGRDRHFAQAIEILKEEYPDLSDRIFYIDYQEEGIRV